MFAQHFQTTYDTDSNAVIIDINNLDHLQSFDYLSNLNFHISSDNVLDSIQKCKSDYFFGPDGIPSVILKECANNIALPLSILFNKSLKNGIFPDIWKKTYVIPLYKKGGKNDVKNYRPIAKLSCIPKLFESVIVDTLSFNIKSIISPQQHGFVRGRSTTTNLLEFVTFCFDNFNNRSQVDTDFSKAFDKLSHDLLLSKLLKLGFNPNCCVLDCFLPLVKIM